ncbi:MAG: glycosyltransferase family 4 protein [Planctomycetes bacterium]|nr:glycosyltransferase family 4 protein [Planctomycetota bacterium]
MEIALVVPSWFPRITGNAVSARRILTGLCSAGHQAKIVDVETLGVYVDAVIAAYDPDVVHAFHARRTGWLVKDRRPLVISLTGTDCARDLEREDTRREVLEACRSAQALVVNHRATAEPLLALDPSLAAKTRIVPKGVVLLEGEWAMRETLGIPPGRVVFVLAGGLRPVKGQLAAIRALDGLDVDLILAGPTLSEDYGAQVRQEALSRPWVRIMDVKPHARMAGVFREADVVLNCSESEGLSNAVLEAMYFGKPVLAHDVPGNRELVAPGVTGLLYRDEAELRAMSVRLRDDAALRATLGQAGAVRARAQHSPEAETRAVLEVYREAIAAVPPRKRTLPSVIEE